MRGNSHWAQCCVKFRHCLLCTGAKIRCAILVAVPSVLPSRHARRLRGCRPCDNQRQERNDLSRTRYYAAHHCHHGRAQSRNTASLCLVAKEVATEQDRCSRNLHDILIRERHTVTRGCMPNHHRPTSDRTPPHPRLCRLLRPWSREVLHAATETEVVSP